MADFTRPLLQSLQQAPLLVADVDGVKCFDRSWLSMPRRPSTLNFEQKLGHLYEDALECLLEASEGIEFLGSHIQIANDRGRTLGELDFVLIDKARQQAIHLELAVKFYLAVEVGGKLQFPGPDPRDNWQRKLDRMREHQFLLSQRSESQTLLKEQYGVDSIEVRQLIYGCLFYPMSSHERPLPSAVNPQCRMGRWLYVSEWSREFSEVIDVKLVPKLLWPVLIDESIREDLVTVSVDKLHELAAGRCTMFILGQSREPIFLVPDDWLLVDA